MIVVTNRIAVAEGFEAEFEERFRKRTRLIDSAPGFINNRIERPIKRRFSHQTGRWEESTERQYYLVRTTWETEQQFWDWTRSDSFREAHANRPPAEMFDGPNVLEIHEIIQDTNAAAT
ncbi:MAG: antibiotic biosynthesis monooxygenase family protein [Candidatus Binatia bacterium]